MKYRILLVLGLINYGMVQATKPLDSTVIIISGYGSDCENLNASLKYPGNNDYGITGTTNVLLNALYQEKPIKIITTGNLLLNIIGHGKLFQIYLDKEISKINGLENIKLPTRSLCIAIDTIIQAALNTQLQNAAFNKDTSKLDLSTIIPSNFFSMENEDFTKGLPETCKYELCYRAPLNRYNIQCAKHDAVNPGNSVYILNPKNDKGTNSILQDLQKKALMPYNLDIKCNSEELLKEVILAQQLKNHVIILNGHGGEKDNDWIGGFEELNFIEIINKFKKDEITLLILLSCFARGRLEKQYTDIDGKITTMLQGVPYPLIIQGKSGSPLELSIPITFYPIAYFLSGSLNYTLPGDPTTYPLTPYALTHPINYYNFDKFIETVITPDNKVKPMDKNTITTLLINRFHGKEILPSTAGGRENFQALLHKITTKEQAETLITFKTFTAPGEQVVDFYSAPMSRTLSNMQNPNDLINLATTLSILR